MKGRNFILQNFPFIEDDFDALTDYQLFSKVVEYVKRFAKDNEEFKKQLEKYENYFENNNHKKGRKDENISFKQILDDAIQEKKELDLKERDKKKARAKKGAM